MPCVLLILRLVCWVVISDLSLLVPGFPAQSSKYSPSCSAMVFDGHLGLRMETYIPENG